MVELLVCAVNWKSLSSVSSDEATQVQLKQPKKASLKKTKEFSVMNMPNTKIDADTIDFYIRKAHAERSEAITSAFGGLTEMVKNTFTAPEAGKIARGH